MVVKANTDWTLVHHPLPHLIYLARQHVVEPWRCEPHRLQCHHLLVMRQGLLSMVVDGEVIKVRGGEAAWFESGCELSVGTGVCLGLFAWFGMRERIDGLPLGSQLASAEAIDAAFDCCEAAIQRRHQRLIRGHLELLLGHLLDDVVEPADDTVIKRTMDWALEHLSEDLVIDRLWAYAGLGRDAFHRRFLAMSGFTPRAWLNQRIAERGAEFLAADPQRPVADIARACGCANAQTFSRIFKRCYGCTPRLWGAETSKP